MTILLALAAAAAAPQPAPLKLFQDWTVGCDNGRACQAVALLPEGDWAAATMVVARGPEPETVPSFGIVQQEGAPAAFAEAGATRLPLVQTPDGLAPKDPAALLGLLRRADELRLLDAAGKPVSRVSLRGASAALLYMDDRQRRIGTETALVRHGPKPAGAVPPPPALPVVRQAATSGAAEPRLDRARLIKAVADTSCDRAAKPEDVLVARLDAANTLVLVPDWCGSGAYNFASIALIADNRGRTRPAQFETPPGIGEGDALVNADWADETGRLSTYAKGRGIGDCGTAQGFVWDGARFRLVELSTMGECRGSLDWITTWRATVR
jgi:hypothetical protein